MIHFAVLYSRDDGEMIGHFAFEADTQKELDDYIESTKKNHRRNNVVIYSGFQEHQKDIFKDSHVVHMKMKPE